MNKSLTKKSYEGVFWTLFDVLINKIGVFVVTLYIAKIVGPEVFGLIGMIAVFISIGNSLVDSGMSTSLIRSPDIDNKDLSTVFFGGLIISVLIYIVFFILSPSIAVFFNQPILKNVVRVYCLVFIISAFRLVQSAMLVKELNFRKNTILSLPAAIVSIVVGILLANNGYGVWSVVYMFISQQLVLTICLWIFSTIKISFSFSKEKFIKHFNFGYKLTLSGLLNTVFSNLNNVLIGRFYPIAQSGYYERAFSINQYTSTVFSAIVGKVSMPALSKIQYDKTKVELILKELMRYCLFFISFIMLFIILFAKEIIIILLGNDWLPAVPYLQIISISTIFLPIHMFNMNILQVYGKSNYFLIAEVIKKVFQLTCVLVLYKFGLMWMISSLVFLSFFELVVNSYFVGKVINFGVFKQLKNIYKICFFLVIIYIALFFLKIEMSKSSNTVFNDFLIIFLMIGFYISYILIYEKSNITHILKLLKR